jgi:hypothetical protein
MQVFEYAARERRIVVVRKSPAQPIWLARRRIIRSVRPLFHLKLYSSFLRRAQ